MTTYMESIVDIEATLEEADVLAGTVVSELCKRGIILPTPQTHPFLGKGAQFARGPNILDAAEVFNDSFRCGMDVSIGRNIWDAGEFGFDLFCPQCHHQIGHDDMDWDATVGEWCKTGRLNLLQCSECSKSSPFSEWFRPEFGFGNLAFEFRSWFLNKDFVDYIANLLQHQIKWVKAQY